MTNKQMLKEVIERRRQWGETRDSDFDWLIKEVEKLQNYLEVYENTLRYMDNKYFKLEGICRSCIKRSDSMFLVGDKVQIIDSMAKEWIGRKAVIRKVLNYPNEPIRYQLDIGGGDWEGSCLEKF